MLSLLVTLVFVLILAGIAIWLLSFLTLDAKISQLIRGLIIIFAVLYVLLTLWHARGALVP